MKRLESSALALSNTVGKLIASHEAFLDALDNGWVLAGEALREWTSSDAADFDEFLAELDDIKSTQVDVATEYHTAVLQTDVADDLELLRRLKALADDAATEETDLKAVMATWYVASRGIGADRVLPLALREAKPGVGSSIGTMVHPSVPGIRNRRRPPAWLPSVR